MPPWIWNTRVGLIMAALIVDGLVGDPPQLPHPVQLLGWVIARLERSLNRGSSTARLLKGAVLVALVVGGTAVGSQLVVAWLQHSYGGLTILVWLTASTLALHSLRRHALQVYRPLLADDLQQARHFTGYIVGRDTDNLNASAITRAVVETVAENTADGITAPLFYLLLFGLPGAMTYKAINTLDSMLGYRNDRLLHFGWAAARLDDLANWLPARLTALLLIPVAGLCGYDASGSWRCLRRDAAKHPSPNSGHPEAAFAGALGVQLGGLNYYQGVAERRATLGDARQPLQPYHILNALRLMQAVSYTFAVLGLICLVVIR